MHHFTTKEIRRISEGLPPWESMSFACGGWLQFYMFGVAKALQDCKLDKDVKYVGCSAGALTALGLALEGEFDQAIVYCNEVCLPKAYDRYTGLFRLSEYVTGCIEKYMIEKFAEFSPIPEGKLQVAITRLPFFQTERVMVHENQEELMKTMLASCAAFPFSPLVKKKGNWYIDGGLSDFQPIVDEDTVTVSPFYFSDCDIKPSRYVPLWWTFMPPRSSDTVEWLYNLGWEDCMAYVRSRGIPIAAKDSNIRRVYDKNEHPYDTPRRVSMHRFLGYDPNKLTYQYVGFIADFLLLVLLIVVWKPLALILIYLELWVRIIWLSLVYLFRFLAVGTTRAVSNVDHTANKYATHKVEQLLEVPQNRKRWLREQHNELWDCITCVYSLSLFLRFISGRPSSVELRKHDRLARSSLLYRVFRHII